MNYELAKKLKDAGFPQKIWSFDLANYAYCDLEDCCDKELHLIHTDNDEGCDVGNDYCHRRDAREQSWVACPTLSELIEACGDCLSHIKKWNGYWWAVSHCGHPEHELDGNNLEEQGPTPEEVVANLWLALNKK